METKGFFGLEFRSGTESESVKLISDMCCTWAQGHSRFERFPEASNGWRIVLSGHSKVWPRRITNPTSGLADLGPVRLTPGLDPRGLQYNECRT